MTILKISQEMYHEILWNLYNFLQNQEAAFLSTYYSVHIQFKPRV